MFLLRSRLHLSASRLSRFTTRFTSTTTDHQSTDLIIKRTPLETAQRTVCTQLLLTRWGIEAALHSLSTKSDLSKEDFTEERNRIIDGNEALTKSFEKVEELFTEKERELLNKDVGSWDPLREIGGMFLN